MICKIQQPFSNAVSHYGPKVNAIRRRTVGTGKIQAWVPARQQIPAGLIFLKKKQLSEKGHGNSCSGAEPDIVSVRMHVPFQASLNGLRIWCCLRLWCRSQMWLGSGVAVAVVQASSRSSNSTPDSRTSICQVCVKRNKIK